MQKTASFHEGRFFYFLQALDFYQCVLGNPVFKARQKRIDAGGSLLLADVARNQLVDITALHPQVFHFACAADFVSQARGLLAFNVLEAKLNLELHSRNTHFVFRRLCICFAAAE